MDVPVTRAVRVWGTSASSAPSVTTSSQLVVRATSRTARLNDRQRYEGSTPRSTTRSRSASNGEERVLRPGDRAGHAAHELDVRAPRLEVEVLLGVDRRDEVADASFCVSHVAAVDDASAASFHPSNPATSTGRRRDSGCSSHMSPSVMGTG